MNAGELEKLMMKIRAVLENICEGDAVDDMLVHLVDLYESAQRYCTIIDQMIVTGDGRADVKEANLQLLSDLYTELYDHALDHAKCLRDPLRKTLDIV